MHQFYQIGQELLALIATWEPKLRDLKAPIVDQRQNRQNRSIKQILGHLIDSASNNIHRTVHLQYQPIPLIFPDYANLGANDRWIAIQKYQEEEWMLLIDLWKSLNIHFVHVINHADAKAMDNVWKSALGQHISLQAMIIDYPRHFKLHLEEIRVLADIP